MKTELVILTPAIAREWLKHNTNNRPLRPSQVENLRLMFSRGEYTLTHQGIAFDEDGVVIDGQHRLGAIAQCPDSMTFPVLVTRGLQRSKTFMVIDTQIAVRNIADVLGRGRDVATTATFLARLYAGRNTGISPAYVEPFVAWIAPTFTDLIAFCGTTRRTWSSAPVRAAAVISIAAGIDRDYVKVIYRALVLSEFDSMPPAVKTVFKARLEGRVRAADSSDMFCRCLKVFDPKYADLSKIQINDIGRALASVKALIDARVFAAATTAVAPQPKKKAPIARANGAKGVSGVDYRLEGL